MSKTTSREGLVLVGDDLGAGGAEALRQGHALARSRGVPLAVVHAVPDPGPIEALLGSLDGTSGHELAHLTAQARATLTARVERLTHEHGITVHVVTGSPHRVVLHEAERLGAACVVVGASSREPTEAFFLGSSAAQIVRHAEVSVLVVRSGEEGGPVLVATDLSDPALPAVQQGIAEAKRRDARLVLLHMLDLAHPMLSALEPAVVIDDESAKQLKASCHQTLAGALARFGAEGTTEVAEGSPTRGIVEVAARLEASLVVVGTHGRTGLARVALGSVAEAVVRRSPCSVWVARNP